MITSRIEFFEKLEHYGLEHPAARSLRSRYAKTDGVLRLVYYDNRGGWNDQPPADLGMLKEIDLPGIRWHCYPGTGTGGPGLSLRTVQLPFWRAVYYKLLGLEGFRAYAVEESDSLVRTLYDTWQEGLGDVFLAGAPADQADQQDTARLLIDCLVNVKAVGELLATGRLTMFAVTLLDGDGLDFYWHKSNRAMTDAVMRLCRSPERLANADPNGTISG